MLSHYPLAEHKSMPAQALQGSMYLHDTIYPGSSTYHRITAIELKGAIDIDVFQKALKQLLNRHDALRSHFTQNEDGTLHQVFLPVSAMPDLPTWPLTVVDASSLKPTPPEKMLETLTLLGQEDILLKPFNLNVGPLWRCALIRFTPTYYQLAINNHHIISDLVSEGILLRDLSAFYNQNSESLPEIPPLAQITQSKEKSTENSIYWRDKLKDLTPLVLKQDISRKFHFQGDRIEFQFETALAAQLQTMAKANQVSMHVILISALYVLLHRYSGQTDICIGTVSANRRHEKYKVTDVVNCLVNGIPLRADLSANPTFIQLLQQIKTVTVEAYQHQGPLDKITREAAPVQTSLYKVLFAFAQLKVELKLNGIEASQAIEPNIHYSRLENFGLNVVENANGSYSCYFEFNTDAFSQKYMTNLKDHYLNLLNSIVAKPTAKLSQLPILNADEKKQITLFNATEKKSEAPCFIYEHLSKRAAKHPEATAWVFHPEMGDPQILSNKLADDLTTEFATYLNTLNIGPEKPVGICVTRSLNLLVAIMSTWKAGGATVALETNLSEKEAIFLKLRTTKPQVVIVDNKTKLLFSTYRDKSKIQFVNIDDLEQLLRQFKKLNLNYKKPTLSPKNLAYITYTSGTTGISNGVEIEHGNLMNAADALLDRKFKPDSKILATAPPTFDAFYFEFLEQLITEQSILHFIYEEGRLSQQKIKAVIQSQKITMATLTPGIIDQLERKDIPSMEYLISMGDKSNKETIRELLKIIQNEYGPSETTMFATQHTCKLGEPHTCIGKPIRNFKLLILDMHGNICPPSVPGKIYISGAGLARGYLANPKLTAEKFVFKKFNSENYSYEDALPEEKSSATLERLYDTGDIGTYLSNDNGIYGVDFVGRCDRQIKLKNGVREELDGIEKELREYPEMKEITVIQDSRKNLIAYFSSNSDKEIFTKDLNSFLSKTSLLSVVRLQGAKRLNHLPLNANGKIDKKHLPEYKPHLQEIVSPETLLQNQLRDIWATALKKEATDFGVDQWFIEVGGTSSDIADIVIAIFEKFEIRINAKELFPSGDISIKQQEDILKPYLLSKQSLAAKIDASDAKLDTPSAKLDYARTPLGASPLFWSNKEQKKSGILSKTPFLSF